MHDQAKEFTLFVKSLYPEYFSNKKVLDVGSGDINGNNRFLFDNCDYHGNDVTNAPNVTIVSKTKDLPFDDNYFDTITSTECFEHDPEYNESFNKIYKMLRPGGLFFFTCASTNRPEHGTNRTSPRDSYGTIAKIETMSDYYKNLTIDDVHTVLDLEKSFSMWDSYYNSQTCDLYFVGIKRRENDHNPSVKIGNNYQNSHVITTSYHN
jgi:SAM-dependent methyltransferase